MTWPKRTRGYAKILGKSEDASRMLYARAMMALTLAFSSQSGS